MKNVIGIDPGNIESALCVYDGTKVVFCEKIDNKNFFQAVKGQVMGFKDSSMMIFIEGIQSYGMPVGQDVFDTCIYIGRLQKELEQWGYGYEMVKRSDVKLHHCHSTRAKDANVRAALIERFGNKGTKGNPGFFYGIAGNDQWSSCAIAIYGYDKLNGR